MKTTAILALLVVLSCSGTAREHAPPDDCAPPSFDDPACAHFGTAIICGAGDGTQWEQQASGELLHYRLSDGEKLCDIAADGHVLWRAK